jgi:glycosyltransferase involved in cell wall biosynthesis
MAAGALRLLAEEPLRQAMGTAARRRAVEVFSQEPVVKRYRAIYERVTGAGAEPAGPGSRPR